MSRASTRIHWPGSSSRRQANELAAPAAGGHDASPEFHRQSMGRAGERRDIADDRSVRRAAVRVHRLRFRARRRRGGRFGTPRVRRLMGPARSGGEGAAAGETRARDSRPRRRAGAHRGARLRQAAFAGAQRRGGVCALLRVLRRRVRQAHRRDDSLSGELHRIDVARAARRHRPHHPVELSVADLRALGRRRAGRGQCVRREAGGRRMPVIAARGGARCGDRAAGWRAQYRHGARPRGGRGARLARGSRSPFIYRIAGHRRVGRRRSREASLPGHAGARGQGSAGRVRRRRSRRRAAGHRQRDRPERRTDVLGGEPARRRASRATRNCWRNSARASRR